MTAGGFDLSGRTVLVTGAASGIGAATARVCAAPGAGRPADRRIPVGRMAEPRRAWPIAFLCCAASYVYGTVLDVNGGVWMA